MVRVAQFQEHMVWVTVLLGQLVDEVQFQEQGSG